MDDAKISQFVEHYSSLDDWELLDTHRRRVSLTEEARIALERVIVHRGTDLAKLQEVEKIESENLAAHGREQQQRARERDARHLKIFWAIAIPLTVFAALFRSEHFLETLVSSLTQAVLLGAGYWAYLRFKRSRNQRKS